MTLNPIVYTEKIVRSFLKYQHSAYPFADPELNEQMRQQLSLDSIRRTPLLKGPYISLSRGFREGATVAELVADGVFHPHMQQLIPGYVKRVYGHQEKAIRAIHDGQPTLVSTGTGSGKTECFLYPIISKCLELRDQQAPAGIAAVLVYPMNALAEDQLDRLRGILAGSGIAFGMYVGKTPELEREVSGVRMPQGSSNADYHAKLKQFREANLPDSIHPYEEMCSREAMRTPGKQPRILLTNVKQLELLLTRQTDIELFSDARLDFLAFDEAHTFSGIQGAETACLIRRLRVYCGKGPDHTTCIATSATIVDKQEPDAARKFAARFFGLPADTVVTVNEEYQKEDWTVPRQTPAAPPGDHAALLTRTLNALESDHVESEVRAAYLMLTGRELASGDWTQMLFDELRTNEVAAQIATALQGPRELRLLLGELERTAGRPVSEEELLAYLALGAAAVKNGRPLLRPVAHAFIRGISGGVVTFPQGNAPKLWLSSADELAAQQDDTHVWRPRVFTCTTCGQHYFITSLKDFEFTGAKPEGGQLNESGAVFWEPMAETNGGMRVVLVDKLISQDEAETDALTRTAAVSFCRHCGAAHETGASLCCACGAAGDQVRLFSVRSSDKSPGHLSSCLSCNARGKAMGRRYREPIRELRATNVSDVHVLAQDMIHHADRKRLLLFADNRQDAAFQAGWMKDHARRFRLRSLMADAISGSEVAIGDIALRMSDKLDDNDSLSRVLIPEVWRAVPKEGSGGSHADERLHFLRIQVLREITMAGNQRIGLEPWGRIKIRYENLDVAAPVIQSWSRRLKIAPDDLKAGIEALLDHLRRRRLLYDARRGIFSRYWQEGDREIQRGYMPIPQGVQGMKLVRAAGDKTEIVFQWHSKQQTLVSSVAKKWGVSPDDMEQFLTELWNYLTDPQVAILVPVTLKSSKDRPLPNCSGVYQIDANKLRISENHGFYRCNRCRRKVSRRTPRERCLAWQCDGTLEFVGEESDDYNLQLLDQRYTMLSPEEHTAMVPQEHRERIENWFKGDGDKVNVLVCTPTLELGVDIGALDSVLLRNVPPLPANYWQRAGRAGRRNRMAVNVTYCRSISHDRSYYNDPLRMLAGRVDPPAFNLRNDLLVSKHVHAALLTRLNQLASNESTLSDDERKYIQQVLRTMFPPRIDGYLFESDGQLRSELFDVRPLAALITRYRDDLLQQIRLIFQQGWPESDAASTSTEALAKHVDDTSLRLLEVIKRLRKRLQWAFKEILRLNKIRDEQGTLEAEDDAHFKRCDRMIKKLKGIRTRQRRETQGVDDINTFSLLASEGFMPGYGLDTGSVVGMAEVPYWQLGSMDFSLPRASSMALREYVPGNLIYANGHRFVARRFHQEAEDEQTDKPVFNVNIERQALAVTSLGAAQASFAANELKAIPVCDVDLVHTSQISDEEETRFQMSVATFGIEQGRHNGGQHFDWGSQPLQLRRGVHFRMVNVGASSLIERSEPELGYPVCEICGYSVSPLSSDRQLQSFREGHGDRCGKTPTNVGFYADVVADAITLNDLPHAIAAYSVLEAIRMASTQLLDMHIDDLHVLVLGDTDRDEVRGVLWDPMPGGSGLLDQITENFLEVCTIAAEILAGCPSDCGSSCNDCLQTFRNGFYHKYLDRHAALELIRNWGDSLVAGHTIPPSQTSTATVSDQGMPVNDAEMKLKHLLAAAGFSSGSFQQQIRFGHKLTLSHQIGSTTPDVFFAGDEDDPEDRGVCIYLDGLSSHIHGNAATAEVDREIRSWLRDNGYQVISISYVELSEREAMATAFKRLAKFLSGKDLATQIAEDTSWFDSQDSDVQQQSAGESASAMDSERWASLLEIADEDVHALLVASRDAGLPLPVVGYELVASGTVVATAELAWPGSQLAVLLGDQGEDYRHFEKQSWDVRYAKETTADSLLDIVGTGK